MRALVVGGSGQVGAVLARQWGAANVVQTFHQHPVEGGLPLNLATVSEEEARRAIEGIDVVFCSAAATHVDACEDQPELTQAINVRGPEVLARVSRSIPFVFLSTDYVFDGARGPYSESDATNPISVYGRSKLAGERAVQAAHPSPLILRTALVYGPDPNRKNFAAVVRRLLSSGQEMRAVTDQVTTPTFNRDLVEAAVGLVRIGATGIFHVGGPELLSRYDFALRVAKAFGLNTELIRAVRTPDLQQRAPRPFGSGLRIEKLLSALPSLRLHTVEEAVADWLRTDDQREMTR